MASDTHSKSYTAYAQVYDAFKGDRSENIQRLLHLIQKYCPNAHTLLDLACGTGSIAQGLPKKYTVVGLDNAPAMLDIAQKKMPHMKLVNADMAHFSLKQKFDVVYCLHNSMNHLLTFHDWEDTFRSVAAHLRQGGVFIFDANPPQRMERMAQSRSHISQAGPDYVITGIIKDIRDPSWYCWDTKVILRHKGNTFTTHAQPTTVSVYPSEKIMEGLRKHFDITDFFIVEYSGLPDEIDRAYFVATKK